MFVQKAFHLFLSSIFLMGFTALASAQNCKDILKFGVWENYEKAQGDAFDQSFANAMCSRSSKDDSGNLKIDGYGSGSYGSKSSDDLCHSEAGTLKINKSWTEAFRKASTDIVAAWKECMGTNNEGSRATIIQNGNANIFSIVLKRYAKGPDGNKETATITTTDPRPACFEGVGQKFQFDGQLHIGPCTRPVSNQEVAVTVNLIRVSKVLTSIFRQSLLRHCGVPQKPT